MILFLSCLLTPSCVSTRAKNYRSQLPSNGVVALSWPVKGRLTSEFGWRWGRPHEGVDIAAPAGTSIRASAEGRVSFAGVKPGYGRIVIIDHPGFQTFYAHLKAVYVKTGYSVMREQKVGEVGMSGHASGPHLHFEIRDRNGVAQNPLQYFHKKTLQNSIARN